MVNKNYIVKLTIEIKTNPIIWFITWLNLKVSDKWDNFLIDDFKS